VNAEASNDPTMGITKPRIVINQRDSTLLKIPEIAVTMNRAAAGVSVQDDEKLVSSVGTFTIKSRFVSTFVL
jgi:hypothetical protein